MNLAIILSKLKTFENPKIHLEQYITDSQVAYEIIQSAKLNKDIDDKIILDLGCGTGILGIGCLIFGAKKVYFVDVDDKALQIAKENIKYVEDEFNMDIMKKAVFILKDVEFIEKNDFGKDKIELIMQNPPFGTKIKSIDAVFLRKSMELSNKIYTFHKFETKVFIDKLITSENFITRNLWKFNFPLKNTMQMHSKRIQYIDVGCWLIEKKK